MGNQQAQNKKNAPPQNEAVGKNMQEKSRYSKQSKKDPDNITSVTGTKIDIKKKQTDQEHNYFISDQERKEFKPFKEINRKKAKNSRFELMRQKQLANAYSRDNFLNKNYDLGIGGATLDIKGQREYASLFTKFN